MPKHPIIHPFLPPPARKLLTGLWVLGMCWGSAAHSSLAPLADPRPETFDAGWHRPELGPGLHHTYDALNRRTSTTSHGRTTRYTFDVHDNLSGVIDPLGRQTSYRFDDLGNLRELISPDTGRHTFDYDAAGNRIRARDARGVTVEYHFDAMGRALHIDYPNDPDVLVTYDDPDPERRARGRTSTRTDALGVTDYAYGPRGNLARETVSIGRRAGAPAFSVGYRFDADNRPTHLTYPSGHELRTTYDAAGNIARLTLAPPQLNANGDTEPVVLAERFRYRPFGPLVSADIGPRPTGPALRLERRIDRQYRITGIHYAGPAGVVSDTEFTLDAAGNVLGIESSGIAHQGTPSNQTLRYDDQHRLVYAEGFYGVRTYAYDALGNRTTATASSADPSAPAVPGLIPGTLANEGLHFTYNDANRPSALRRDTSSTPLATYTYNAAGLRVRKTTPEQDTVYHYSPQGQLLAELGPDAQPRRQYLYLDGQPFALLVLEPEPALYFYLVDHLGTPHALVDTEGTVVWQARYTPFGVAEVRTAEITNHLRLPGQYFDPESALHYNGFRYYQPDLGRYVQSDPIGLAGGTNTYVYALGNPLRWTDPLGLYSPQPGPNCFKRTLGITTTPTGITRTKTGRRYIRGRTAIPIPAFTPISWPPEIIAFLIFTRYAQDYLLQELHKRRERYLYICEKEGPCGEKKLDANWGYAITDWWKIVDAGTKEWETFEFKIERPFPIPDPAIPPAPPTARRIIR